MTTSDTLIDTLYDGRYRIRRKVGSGGMANVYLADDETLGRQVAIKVLDVRHSSDEAFVERFLREASSAARLNHPNIVQVYDRGHSGDTYYIAMEFVDGLTLKELIQRRGALSQAEVLAYGKQAASALRFAHRNGIVHRDIKPHNMMVDHDGRLKIADFGIARAGADSGLTEVGSIVGTAQYLSPEQAQGKTVAATSDLYSLGVVLFEMATGRVPFEGDSPVNVALRHVNDAVPRPSSLNPDISPAVEAIILRALRKEPGERYQTADELIDDLDDARNGTVSSATAAMTRVLPGLAAGAGAGATTTVQPMVPPGRMEAASSYATAAGYGAGLDDPEPEPERSRRWPWLLLLLALLLIGGGAAWYLTSSNKGTQPPPTPHTVQKNVPDVTGKGRSAAVALLRQHGFDPRIDPDRQFSDQPAGTVISQDPSGGTKVDKGSPVTLVLSKGVKPAAMPDLGGKTQSQARATLRQAGINPDTATFGAAFSDKPQGTVIDQDPKPNDQVPAGTAITVTLSKGVENTTVPNEVGKDVDAATQQLQGRGFVVTTVQQDSDKPKGTVLSQDPTAGNDAPNGSTVRLTVASGYNTVPDLSSMTPDQANQAVQDAGFTPQTDEQVDTTMSPGDPDQVGNQSPNAGQRRLVGSTVTYVVRHAPPGP